MELPVVEDRLPLVDWESHVVTGYLESGDFSTLLQLAETDFETSLAGFDNMSPQWNMRHIAHSIKGIARNLAFDRLETYARNVQGLGDVVQLDPSIRNNFKTLIDISLREARSRTQ